MIAGDFPPSSITLGLSSRNRSVSVDGIPVDALEIPTTRRSQ